MILANTSKAPELNLTTNELKIRRKGRPFYDEKFLGMTNLAQSDPDTSISHSDDQIQITHINNPGDFYVIRVKDKLKIHELSKSIKSKVRSYFTFFIRKLILFFRSNFLKKWRLRI